jgi:hypothetical protein
LTIVARRKFFMKKTLSSCVLMYVLGCSPTVDAAPAAPATPATSPTETTTRLGDGSAPTLHSCVASNACVGIASFGAVDPSALASAIGWTGSLRATPFGRDGSKAVHLVELGSAAERATFQNTLATIKRRDPARFARLAIVHGLPVEARGVVLPTVVVGFTALPATAAVDALKRAAETWCRGVASTEPGPTPTTVLVRLVSCEDVFVDARALASTFATQNGVRFAEVDHMHVMSKR